MSDPQRPSLAQLMNAVANDGETLESPSGTALDPADVLALIEERNGLQRAFESSETDLQDAVRELRSAEAERDLLRRDVDRLRGLVHSMLANDPNEVVADAHPVTVLDVWRRDAYLVMTTTDDG